MKRLVVAVLTLWVGLVPVRAASNLEVEADLKNGTQSAQVYLTKQLSGPLGAFGYLYHSVTWSEAYVGLTYAPAPYVEVGLGYGAEQAKPSGRMGGSLWVGHGKLSACYLFEDGGSGPWHKLTLDYQLTPKLSLGLAEKSFVGKGVRVGYKLNSSTSVRYTVYEHTELATLCLGF